MLKDRLRRQGVIYYILNMSKFLNIIILLVYGFEGSIAIVYLFPPSVRLSWERNHVGSAK